MSRAREVRLEQRLVSGDDGGTAGRQRLDQLGLRAGDVLDGPDELQVHGRDVRDQAEVGPRERGKPGDLAEAAHPHLDDADLGLRLDPGERERDAELVVVVPLGSDRVAVRRAESGEDVLRRGLPGRAGDPDDPGARAVANGSADRGERGVCIVRDERGCGTRARAWGMKSAPSPTATNRSPSSIRRESICIPVTSSAQGRVVSRPSGSTMLSSSGITGGRSPAAASRGRPRGRRTAPCRWRAPVLAPRRGRRPRRSRPVPRP